MANKNPTVTGMDLGTEDQTVTIIRAVAEYPKEYIDQCNVTMARLSNEGGFDSVKSDADMDFVMSCLAEIKKTRKEVEAKRKDLTKPFRDGATEVNDFFRPFNEWADATEKKAKAAMGAYQQEKQRKAALAQAEADKKARAERARLEARAEKAAEKGDMEKAETLSEQVDTVVAKEVETKKVKGQSYKWEVEVTDKQAFIEHAIKDPYLKGALEVNTGAITNVVRTIGDPDIKIPGLTVTRKISFAIRS